MTTQSPIPPVKRQVAFDDVLPATLLLSALRALRRGDFEASLPLGYSGIAGEIIGPVWTPPPDWFTSIMLAMAPSLRRRSE